MNRNVFFKNAAMLCVLVLVSMGCGDSSAQSAVNQDGSRLVGSWVEVVEDSKNIVGDGSTWVFNSDGTGTLGESIFKYAVVAGKIMIRGKRKESMVSYDVGGDFVVSNDGKTLFLYDMLNMGSRDLRDIWLKKTAGK